MSKEFSFSKHGSDVMWKETLWYNGLRAVGAGLVIGMLMLLTGEPTGEALGVMAGFAGVYYVFLLPMGMVLSWLSSAFSLAGVLLALFSLFVAVGDPLVYTLSKVKPEAVPVDRPSFFSMELVTMVTSPFAD